MCMHSVQFHIKHRWKQWFVELNLNVFVAHTYYINYFPHRWAVQSFFSISQLNDKNHKNCGKVWQIMPYIVPLVSWNFLNFLQFSLFAWRHYTSGVHTLFPGHQQCQSILATLRCYSIKQSDNLMDLPSRTALSTLTMQLCRIKMAYPIPFLWSPKLVYVVMFNPAPAVDFPTPSPPISHSHFPPVDTLTHHMHPSPLSLTALV